MAQVAKVNEVLTQKRLLKTTLERAEKIRLNTSV